MTLLYLAMALIAAAFACALCACVMHVFRPRMPTTGLFGSDPFMYVLAPVRRLTNVGLCLAFLAAALSVLSLFVT